ncbi:MAG TPA: DUF2950 domain-containing protein [Desulfomonilia bacterium]
MTLHIEIREIPWEDTTMRLLKIRFQPARFLAGCAIILFTAAVFSGTGLAAQTKQMTFPTPAAAVDALVKAIGNGSEKEISDVLGPGSKGLISSGDAVEDRKDRDKFILLFGEKNLLRMPSKSKFILYIGKNDWPFPIPIVKTGESWHFDAKQGRGEILSRRIGKNELGAIQTCLAIADAEREYASVDRDGNGRLEYAQKLVSSQGKKDGLYWKANPGENPSPLGPLAAKAQGEGYKKTDEASPYNGYYYRILTSQGASASGGAYSYIVNGHMIGGFALVAYPASYGNSGVMTFIVNFEGIVYQKDLGPGTAGIAGKMKTFNPDSTWKKAQ